MFKKILYLLLVVSFFPLMAFGATDGLLGTTSTGTLLISLSINSVIKISEMDDLTFSFTPGVDSGPISDSTTFCVYTNNGTGNYSATVTSANASGTTFRAFDGSSNYIVYTAEWDDDIALGSPSTLQSGVQLTGITGADTTNQDCLATDVAVLRVTFSDAALQAAAQGSYSDTITAIVAPE